MIRVENALKDIKNEFPDLLLLENEALSAHSTFRIGGNARVIAVPEDEASLIGICGILKGHGLLPFILGNGSNMLFPDEGLNEVFLISTEKLQKLERVDEVTVCASSGVSLARLANFAHQNALSGLEFASGIPATVGGGLRMNAGAYGGELKDCVKSVRIYSVHDNAVRELNNAECGFKYRGSAFTELRDAVILSAVFELKPAKQCDIAAKMQEYNAKRREKQPLEYPSAGSAFKRPEGYFAAALIDEAGLKGFSVGGAQVSEKHAGFVVNRGGATAHDVRALFEEVERIVLDKSGVSLEPEVIIIPANYSLNDD